jgi:hypothetical protein
MLVTQHSIVYNACRVYDATQRRHALLDRIQHAAYIFNFGDVA